MRCQAAPLLMKNNLNTIAFWNNTPNFVFNQFISSRKIQNLTEKNNYREYHVHFLSENASHFCAQILTVFNNKQW